MREKAGPLSPILAGYRSELLHFAAQEHLAALPPADMVASPIRAFGGGELIFAVLVACNRGLEIAIWKTRQAARTLIRRFAPKLNS